LEGLNPTGSVKDRAAATMIAAKVAEGTLNRESILLDASSGNMASALAAFGRALDIAVHVVANATITTDKRRLIELFGGVVIVNDFGPYTYDGYRKCRHLLTLPGAERYCFLDQLHNPMNPYAHETGTGPEIMEEIPRCRLVVGSLGSGGTMLGVARAVRAAGHPARVAAVSSAPGSRLPGVGAFADGDYRTPFIRTAHDQGLFDFEPTVSVSASVEQQAALTACGLFCGPQTGAVTAVALQLVDELGLDDDEVVVISGDAGWKNWSVGSA
jgi:cysteine synthase